MEILNTQQMVKAEQMAIASGIDEIKLMLTAGSECYKIIKKYFPKPGKSILLCGPGNNGGDALVIANLLLNSGWTIKIINIGDIEKKKNLLNKLNIDINIDYFISDNYEFQCDLIIDGIFGTGLTRKITDDTEKVINKVNACNIPILSIDIPSGVDGSSGKIMGCSIKADYTVTFFRKKIGHLLYPGAEFCGKIYVADIGIKETLLNKINIKNYVNHRSIWFQGLPIYSGTPHKYNKGNIGIISGEHTQTGAARLSAMASLRIGAGVVTVISPSSAINENAAHLTAIMLKEFKSAKDLKDIIFEKKYNTILIGQAAGVNKKTKYNLKAILDSKTVSSIVIDADALTSFSSNGHDFAKLLAHKSKEGKQIVMTPHMGEFKKVFTNLIIQITKEDIEKCSKIDIAKVVAAETGATIVLKGADTIIAESSGKVVINSRALPQLATAGSGDILAGIISVLIGQGIDPFFASCAAVHIHSEIGLICNFGYTSEDMLNFIPKALYNCHLT